MCSERVAFLLGADRYSSLVVLHSQLRLQLRRMALLSGERRFGLAQGILDLGSSRG